MPSLVFASALYASERSLLIGFADGCSPFVVDVNAVETEIDHQLDSGPHKLGPPSSVRKAGERLDGSQPSARE